MPVAAATSDSKSNQPVLLNSQKERISENKKKAERKLKNKRDQAKFCVIHCPCESTEDAGD